MLAHSVSCNALHWLGSMTVTTTTKTVMTITTTIMKLTTTTTTTTTKVSKGICACENLTGELDRLEAGLLDLGNFVLNNLPVTSNDLREGRESLLGVIAANVRTEESRSSTSQVRQQMSMLRGVTTKY